MNNAEIEKILSDSLLDFRLDQDEKNQLKQLVESLRFDQINFLRNKSFALCREYIEAGGSDAFRALNWLERVIKAVLPIEPEDSVESSAFFSPGKDCRNKIISLVKRAKKRVDICVFTISDNLISDAIQDAYERGVRVTIISDNDKANDRGSDVYSLSEKGVKVLFDDSPNHMHHKFALIDDKILINGSFNWTRSATTSNEENIVVTRDEKLVASFKTQFDKLKRKFKVKPRN